MGSGYDMLEVYHAEDGQPVVFGVFRNREGLAELLELYFAQEEAEKSVAELQAAWEELRPAWVFYALEIAVEGKSS